MNSVGEDERRCIARPARSFGIYLMRVGDCYNACGFIISTYNGLSTCVQYFARELVVLIKLYMMNFRLYSSDIFFMGL
jgi:hypothetical protein